MGDTSNDNLRKDVQAILSSYKGPLPKHHQKVVQGRANGISTKGNDRFSTTVPSSSESANSAKNSSPVMNKTKTQNNHKFPPKPFQGNNQYKPQVNRDDKKSFPPKSNNYNNKSSSSNPRSTTTTTMLSSSSSSSSYSSLSHTNNTGSSNVSPFTPEDVPVSLIDLQNLPDTRMSGKLGTDSGNWYHATNEINFSTVTESTTSNDNNKDNISSKKRKRDTVPTPSTALVKTVDLTTISTFTPMIQKLYDIAQRLFETEIATAENRKSSSSHLSQSHDAKWIAQVLTSGTSSDKLAALVLLVQQSPIHSLKHLDSLLQLANKKSHRDAMQAIEAVKDLFLTNLLPHDRKLYTLHMRIHQYLQGISNLPANLKNNGKNNGSVLAKYKLTGETLVRWYYEDELKQRYGKFLRILSTAMTESTITFFKIGTMKTAQELLAERPEGEATLLTMLVNKLGDPEGSIAAKANSLLTQLVERHEAMKSIIIREVRQFVYQPNLPLRSQYYGILFLNQLPLQRHYPSLAIDLISTYFTLFETCIKRNQLGSKLLSALLTGINRAFPYATEAPTNSKNEVDNKSYAQNQLREIETRSDVLFTVLHRGTPNTSIQALVMLQNIAQRRMAEGSDGSVGPSNGTGVSSQTTGKQLTSSNTTDADEESTEPVTGIAFVNRYYRALYSKLTIDDILATNKHALFLNVIFKSVKYDESIPRCKAILKRLLQVALLTPTQFTTGVLVLVAELLHLRPELRTLIVSDNPSSVHATTLTGGNVSSMIDPPTSDSDEKDEDNRSIDSDASEVLNIIKPSAIVNPTNPAETYTAIPTTNVTVTTAAKISSTTTINSQPYDPYKREPLYANSEHEYMWELIPFAAHSHPSVRMFADHIMTNPGESLNYQGDPLADFSLMAFLDRYVFKNPKKRNLEAYGKDGKGGGGTAAAALKQQSALDAELAEGYAIVQGKDPETTAALAAGLAHGTSRMQRRISRHGRVDTATPASSTEFAHLDASLIREDDKFLHTYFRTKAIIKENTENDKKKKEEKEKERRKASSNGDEDDEMDSDGSMDEDEIDAFADKVAEKLMQDAKGPSDDEDDDDDDDDDDADDDDADDNDEGLDYSTMDFGEPNDDDENDDGDDDGTEGYPHSGNYSMDNDDDSDEELYKWEDESDEGNDLDDEDETPVPPTKKSKAQETKTKNGKKEDTKTSIPAKASTTVFADADDYAHLLESDIGEDVEKVEQKAVVQPKAKNLRSNRNSESEGTNKPKKNKNKFRK